MSTNDGGPDTRPDKATRELRDWFAGMAMHVAADCMGAIHFASGHVLTPSNVVAAAYELADAMIAEREKQEPADG